MADLRDIIPPPPSDQNAARVLNVTVQGLLRTETPCAGGRHLRPNAALRLVEGA